jgi:hypothetical protein
MDQGVIIALKACYFCQAFVEMTEFWTGQAKLSRIIGAHLTFLRALITLTQLGRKCQ